MASTGDRRSGEARGKESLGRPRHVWEDNIKMDHQEGGWEGMDWIALAYEKEI